MRLILVIILFFARSSIYASDLRIISADFKPYTYETPVGGSGAMYEIVQELAKLVGQSQQIEFMPWLRAQNVAQENHRIAIFPTARVPEREDKYVWLMQILQDKYVFISKKDSNVDISSIDATRKLRVCVFRGSLGESLIKQWGFHKFESFTNDGQCVKMLKLNRLDVWVAPLSFKNRYEVEGGLGEKDLRVGASLLVLHEYLAASKSLDSATIQKWRKAFEIMKHNGRYVAIMKKYGFKPLD